MKLRTKLLHLGIYVVLILLSSVVFILLFWRVYPYDFMHINNSQNIQLTKEVYKVGDSIIYTFDYCKDRKIVGTVYRSMINSTITNFTPIEGDLPTGCHIIKKTDLHIPEFTQAGTYHLEATLEYKVNLIRTVIYYWRSEDFKVIE